MAVAELPVHVPLVTRPMGIWGSLNAARRNLLEILPEIATRQPMVSGRTAKRWHMVMDPEAIRRMLLENLDNYPKSLVTKNLLKPAIGESLFIAEGAHWRWQRRAAAPAFSHRNVSGLAPVMSAAADHSLARIEAAGARATDMYAEMVRATFEVIGNVTFSEGSSFDPEEVHRAIDAYIDAAGRMSLFDILGFPDWVPRPGRLFSGRGVTDMKALADSAVEARRDTGPHPIPEPGVAVTRWW